MKNAVFWDVAPCRYFVNRRFGGTYRLHLQAHAGSSLVDSYTLKMEVIRFSETSVNKIPNTGPHPGRRHSSFSVSLHSHWRDWSHETDRILQSSEVICT
jgi:hypothetical protein